MNATITAAQAQQQIDLFAQKKSARINSIDLLRGLIMIIMALDHTRDFFHTNAWTDDPLNLSTTTPLLYFTRWITHFCAPNFVFLAGASIWFQSVRKSKKELSIFLFKRGLWLVFIEIFVMNFAFSFDPGYHLIALQTIWSIGISMIVLACLIWLPYTAILIIGVVIVFGHNLLDFYEAGKQQLPVWYSILHRPGIYPLNNHYSLFVFYPFLPWTGLMILGYCFGKLFLKYDDKKRRHILLYLAIGLLLFFTVLRYSNVYGDPIKWSTQKNSLYTFLSFMKVQKYPPSLLYMCATVSGALLFLALAGNTNSRISRIITVYGRVPFLYYVLHFFLIHLVSMCFFFARGHAVADGIHANGQPLPNFIIPGEGVSLGWLYVIWLCVVLSLYSVCKWFSEYKRTHKNWWLSYL